VKLGIFLPSIWENAFIFIVLFLGPIVAAGLLWTRQARAGAWLLFWSMLGSLLFELHHHFLALSSDHVSQIRDDFWGEAFRTTALGGVIFDALGCLIAIPLLFDPRRGHSTAAEGKAS
jgi:hypothetical protein